MYLMYYLQLCFTQFLSCSQLLQWKLFSEILVYLYSRYFLVDFYLPPKLLNDFKKELKVDSELIRPRITKVENHYGEEGFKFNYLTCNKSYRKPPGYKDK